MTWVHAGHGRRPAGRGGIAVNGVSRESAPISDVRRFQSWPGGTWQIAATASPRCARPGAMPGEPRCRGRAGSGWWPEWCPC